MMENKSLFIIDDSSDNRLKNARQQNASNDIIFLNKFEDAQIEYDRRMRMPAIARNQIRMAEFGDINVECIVEIEKDRITQKVHDYRNRKRRNDNDESQQIEFDA